MVAIGMKILTPSDSPSLRSGESPPALLGECLIFSPSKGKDICAFCARGKCTGDFIGNAFSL